MNKVITINLHGNAYQLEEGGYELLREYLDNADRRLAGNPDRDEIIADIEQAIADKCRAVLGPAKTVVVTREVQQIIEEMGPVENAAAESDPAGTEAAAGSAGPENPGAASTASAGPGGAPRRLYKIYDGAMVGGVCNGIAAYFNFDVTVVRVLFAVATVLWGVGALVYFLLWFLLPTAGTSAEKAAAYGMPSTAQEFIRRAREGYYEGMKNFTDPRHQREWRRHFRREMRGWRKAFRHQMRANAYQWQQHHANFWAGHTPVAPGSWFALPFVSLLRWAVMLALIFSLVSLLNTGAVFGLALPAGLAVWGAVLVLLFLYHVVVWPLKAMRRAYYYNAGSSGAPPFIWAFDGLTGAVFLVALIYLAAHHWTEVHHALLSIPSTVHEGVDAISAWWSDRANR